MKQSCAMSLLDAVAHVALGYGIAVFSFYIVLHRERTALGGRKRPYVAKAPRLTVS